MVLSFLIALILWAPQTSWGFSAETAANYQAQIIEKRLWTDPQWIKLGHYRKNLFGGYRSPIQGSFFISPDGATDPKAELLATIDLLFLEKESGSKAQCRYLARTAWLKKVLAINANDFTSCPERDQWKEQLGAKEIYIVFASSDLSSAGASFGHTFLRAHNPKNKKERELLDYGINYAAFTGTESGALYALKGLFGFYPGTYSMLPYYQKMREYTNLEGRNLWDYKLNLTQEQVGFLIDHLLELEGSFSPYYFADDNCSQQILELIEVARPELNVAASFRDITIPLDTVKVLAENEMLSDEGLRTSLQTEWRFRYNNLSFSQRNELKKVIENPRQLNLSSIQTNEQAEVLETSLSYFAIQEYRQQKDFKDVKYPLSVARARLGAVTDPLEIPKPASPLSSPDSVAYYLSYGKLDKNDFYSIKWRRAFHDLLSDDSGLSPFSHLEIFSLDLRYFPEFENLDLFKMILLKTFSTTPVNVLDTPTTWKLDIGTEEKMNPYLHFGAGLSWDVAGLKESRFSLLAVSENYRLSEKAQPFLGIEGLLMTKIFSDLRGLLGAQYLHDLSLGRNFKEYQWGLAMDVSRNEIRFTGRIRDNIPEWNLTVIF